MEKKLKLNEMMFVNNSSTIIIFRDFKGIDLLKPYDICINNQEINSIIAGETFIINIPSGEYKLKMKVDWAESECFDFKTKENEMIFFETGHLGNANNPFTIFRSFMHNKYMYLKKININFDDILDNNLELISNFKNLTLKNNIEIETFLLSAENSKKIFEKKYKFPKKNYNNSSIKNRLLILELIFILMILVHNNFDINKSFKSLFSSLFIFLLVYFYLSFKNCKVERP